jgi:gluconolactonase
MRWKTLPALQGTLRLTFFSFLHRRMSKTPSVMKPLFAVSLAASAAFAQEPTFEKLDPALDELIAPGTKIETLAQGFRWTEGPVWSKATNEFLFSDIPNNVINAWSDGKGLRVFMKPSGYTGISDYGREAGSNGLTFDGKGRLVLAEHGDRRIAVLTEGGGKMTVADKFDGKRLNSPNDVTVHSDGSIFFTDPIYGLPKGENDPTREIDFCGVYRIGTDGKVTVISKEIERPNGIALSHDEKTLFVANSHKGKFHIYSFPLAADGTAGEMKTFFDATKLDGKGSTDGLKTDDKGNVWTTGPGGLLVISRDGKLLGRALTFQPTSNVAFGGADGKSVYLTANDRIMRFQRK